MIRRPALRALMAVLATGFVLLAGAVFAACDDFDEDRLASFDRERIAEIQLGLRSAYRDENRFLRDGRLGEYTRARLRALCEDVPRLPRQDDLQATLDLTDEYGRMERLWPNWARDLFSLTLRDDAGAPSSPMLGVRLAGTLPMKTLTIGRRALPYDCADPVGALADHPAGSRAFGALMRLNPGMTAEQVCALLPVAGGEAEWQQAMDRLGQIASDRRTGALAVLQSGDFLEWIEASREARLRRLVGTVPAVVALLDEYMRKVAPGDVSAGGPCAVSLEERTTTYYELTQEDVDGLDLLISLTPRLDAFRAEAGGFDNPQALWQALRPVLAQDLDDCILSTIEKLVTGPDRLPLSFRLKPSDAEALMADETLTTALPVLEELAPLTTPTRAEFIDRIRAGLEEMQEARIAAQVAAVADTLAAASEPALPVTDTPILEAEEGEEPPPPTPVITVTDATDEAVASAVDNPELTEALRNTPMVDATVPELIRSQARAAVRLEAERQVQRAVDAQIARIEPAITSDWSLTKPLMDEILALPYVRAATADATADGARARLAPLVGASYPSFRLFDDALDTVSIEPGKVPFSDFVVQRIVQKAQKTVPKPESPRALAPLQIEGCSCIPAPEGEEPPTTYGFYPFWLAPLAQGSEGAAPGSGATGDAGAEAQEAPRPLQTLVDFGAINQIAFYGLEIVAERVVDGQTGNVSLRHADRWQEARRTFVNSAHHYRARADLAFDLRDWITWNDDAIEEAVAMIVGQMDRFDRRAGWEPGDFIDAIPTLFETPQPDGVTLIFHGYDGVGFGTEDGKLNDEGMKRMIRIIKRTYESLPGRDRLQINVAFDFPLVQEVKIEGQARPELKPILEEPVFDALYELLREQPYVFANETKPATNSEGGATTAPQPPALDAVSREKKRVVSKILLFLERPTTDAKKGLRFRMEQGLFQGELRRQALRSIIPVLPPGGHREVRTTIKENDPDEDPQRDTRPDYSQLDDDVVYFKDNFGGIGFWSVPDAGAGGAADAPPSEAQVILATVRAHFFPPVMQPELATVLPVLRPAALAEHSPPLGRVCGYVCPNRAAITLAAAALFAVLVLATWRSFYSGVVEKYAFRFMMIGLVWIGNIVLILTLVALAVCDPLAVWPFWLCVALVAVLGALLLYNNYQRIKNSPMP